MTKGHHHTKYGKFGSHEGVEKFSTCRCVAPPPMGQPPGHTGPMPPPPGRTGPTGATGATGAAPAQGKVSIGQSAATLSGQLQFNRVDINRGGLVTGGPNYRIIVPKSGFYDIGATVRYTCNSGAPTVTIIRSSANGAMNLTGTTSAANGATTVTVRRAQLLAGDEIRVNVTPQPGYTCTLRYDAAQGNSATLNVQENGLIQPSFWF